MNSLFQNYLSLFQKLNTIFGKKEWKEDFNRLFATYEGAAKDFKSFFTEEKITRLQNGAEGISFRFNIEDTELYNKEFIESSKYIQDEQWVLLTIALNKEIDFSLGSNMILFFDMKSFISNFKIKSDQLISFFKRVDHTKQIYLYLPIDNYFRNSFIRIMPHEEIGKEIPKELDSKTLQEMNSIIENREELTRVEQWFPLPHLFSVETNNACLNQLMKQNLFYVSLSHIANKFKDNQFIIRGQKNLELFYNDEYLPINASILFSIFKFSFGEEQTQDKLEITRNIITIYLHEETIQQFDIQLEKMKLTIERHFSMYVQDKIKKFFDDTKDAIDLAHKYALEAREAADKIATNISTSILALITAAFSGIVIMARGNFLFLVAALGLHILYFILSYAFNRHFALKKKKDIEYIYDLTSENFSNIAPDEKEEIKEKYIIPAIKSITVNLKKYFSLTLILIIIMVLLIVGTYFAHDLNYSKKSNVIDEQNIENIQDNITEYKNKDESIPLK